MANFTALFDASVLYSAPMRDLLLSLALTDLFRAKWSNAIHEEWIRNLLENRPDLKREKLERTRKLMDENVRDCLVTGYEKLITGLVLPDPNDRHVLAAAIQGRCDVIVTANLKDFPEKQLSPHGIEAQHPDEFIVHLIDLSPGSVISTAKTIREGLRNPKLSVEDYLDSLEKSGLVITAHELRNYSESL